MKLDESRFGSVEEAVGFFESVGKEHGGGQGESPGRQNSAKKLSNVGSFTE